MKFIKFALLGCFIIFINGCVPSQNIGITYQTNNTSEFENYVNTVEKNLNHCYTYKKKKDDRILKVPKYIVREDYYEPRHVKLKLFYGLSSIPHGVLYFLKNENNTEIIIRERDEKMIFIKNPKLKNWIKNNMECKK